MLLIKIMVTGKLQFPLLYVSSQRSGVISSCSESLVTHLMLSKALIAINIINSERQPLVL